MSHFYRALPAPASAGEVFLPIERAAADSEKPRRAALVAARELQNLLDVQFFEMPEVRRGALSVEGHFPLPPAEREPLQVLAVDHSNRKSTRLNSSHLVIS